MSQLLSRAKEPHYPLIRGLDEPQTWSGCLREAKYPLPLPRFTPREHLPHNLVATSTNLKYTYLHSKRNFITYLLLLTSSIMEPHNLDLVFKRGFGNRISFNLLNGMA